MKHPNTKPYEPVMRFFTPDLFVRFNSDDDVADRASAEWDATRVRYRAHLDAIRDRLPQNVRDLTTVCLHDAELVARSEHAHTPRLHQGQPPAWSATEVLSLATESGVLLSVLYALWDHVREYDAPPVWPFPEARHREWLYEELDVSPQGDGYFVHRILFNDGRVVEIPFADVMMHEVPLKAIRFDAVRQSA